jgi:signal transduction histidine kinase
VKSARNIRDIPIVMLTGSRIAVDDRGSWRRRRRLHAKSSDSTCSARVLAQIRRKQFGDEPLIREQLLRWVESMEARTAKVAEARAVLVGELEAKNAELTFSYSVLMICAPHCAASTASAWPLEDYAEKLTPTDASTSGSFASGPADGPADRLTRPFPRDAERFSARAGRLDGDRPYHCRPPERTKPERQVEFVIAGGLIAEGDKNLLAIVMENLIGNAWKYSSKRSQARIEVGTTSCGGRSAYFVRDDGAGFHMALSGNKMPVFKR